MLLIQTVNISLKAVDQSCIEFPLICDIFVICRRAGGQWQRDIWLASDVFIFTALPSVDDRTDVNER